MDLADWLPLPVAGCYDGYVDYDADWLAVISTWGMGQNAQKKRQMHGLVRRLRATLCAPFLKKFSGGFLAPRGKKF